MRQQNYYQVGAATSELKIIFGKQSYVNEQLSGANLLLGSPYPNPTAGQVTVPFTVPQSSSLSSVTYKIYDNTGKIVESKTANYEPGIYQIHWQFERAVLYVIQLQLDGKSASKKIIVK